MVPVWYNGAFLPPSTRVFWADGPPLQKPELATRHDPQTTRRPEKFASNPTPVAASNATPCTHRASYIVCIARFAAPSGVRSAFLGFRCPLVFLMSY